MSTRVIKVGNKLLGGNNPILIQTMADIKTSKVDEVVKEAQECEKIGADLIRFSVLDDDDIEGLKIIKRNLNIPIVADIHFDYLLAIKAINAGVDKIRINPGNIGNIERVKAVTEALGDTGRILVRESGTEPLLRVMVEAETEEVCRKYVDQVVDVVKAKGHIAS